MTPEMLERWAKIWTDELKKQLQQTNYPFSPGYNNSSPERNKYTGSKVASGSLLNSISAEVKQEDNETILELFMLSYWRYVNDGVRPSQKYPTDGYVSAGGKSEFISALVKWYGSKLGITGKEALSRAFGTRQNIWRFGVAPSNFYTNTLDVLIDKMTTEFGDDWFEYMTELITARVLD